MRSIAGVCIRLRTGCTCGREHICRPTMTICAAKDNGIARVHGHRITIRMAAAAADTFFGRKLLRLRRRGWRVMRVDNVAWFLTLCSFCRHADQQQEQEGV